MLGAKQKMLDALTMYIALLSPTFWSWIVGTYIIHWIIHGSISIIKGTSFVFPNGIQYKQCLVQVVSPVIRVVTFNLGKEDTSLTNW
uniref:Putative ovule protein n=1 Tax=Solanum chacoense TaxID=4108 RepID=A0A0V0GR53_SOLCH